MPVNFALTGYNMGIGVGVALPPIASPPVQILCWAPSWPPLHPHVRSSGPSRAALSVLGSSPGEWPADSPGPIGGLSRCRRTRGTPIVEVMSTSLSLSDVASQTPTERNRVVDALRAGCIAVVVIWHCSLSAVHISSDGTFAMPNPIDSIPGGWVLTWLLQVMPLFFVVAGYTTHLALSHRRAPAMTFWRKRVNRLLTPLVPMLVLWAVIEVAGRAFFAGTYRPVFDWAMPVFVPLWFIGMLGVVTALAPLTHTWHLRAPVLTLGSMAAGVVACDLVRFGLDFDPAGWFNTVLVFAFCHQLGYAWRDGRLDRSGRQLAWLGFAALVGVTSLGPYPGSMVATPSTAISNMAPTTMAIALVGIFQLGLAICVTPWLERILQSRRAWSSVITVNVVAMPVFVWHMTALLAFLVVSTAAGFEITGAMDSTWWLLRPVWIAGPVALGVPMVWAVHRVAPRWSGIPRLNAVSG